MSSKENLKDALIRSKRSSSELKKKLEQANRRIIDLEKKNIIKTITIACLEESNKPKIVKWFNRILMKIRYGKEKA